MRLIRRFSYDELLKLKVNRVEATSIILVHLSGLFGVINLDEKYFKGNLLGTGSFANVYKAISCVTQIRRALK